MKRVALCILLATTTVSYSAGRNDKMSPTTQRDCGQATREHREPTVQCGFNDFSMPNVGVFEQFNYWNGSQCTIGQRLVRCDG